MLFACQDARIATPTTARSNDQMPGAPAGSQGSSTPTKGPFSPDGAARRLRATLLWQLLGIIFTLTLTHCLQRWRWRDAVVGREESAQWSSRGCPPKQLHYRTRKARFATTLALAFVILCYEDKLCEIRGFKLQQLVMIGVSRPLLIGRIFDLGMLLWSDSVTQTVRS